MQGKVRSIAKGGEGVLSHEGIPVFIPGVLPGETVEFSLLSNNKKFARGRLKQILEPSPFRVQPLCPHYPLCGGCNFQHIVYFQQLHYKKEILIANLRKLAKIQPPPELQTIGSPPFRYRSRVEFQIQKGEVGFFQRQSKQLVPIDSCPVIPEGMERFIAEIRHACRPYPCGQVQVLSNGADLSALIILPEKQFFLSATHDLIISLKPYRFRVRPDNFLQANLFMLPVMLELLEKELQGKTFRSAADLFCGIGFFTIPLAYYCREVFALENDENNIRTLKLNLRLNQRESVHIISRDIEKSALPQVELLVIDPPRAGLKKEIIEKIAIASPREIIYFSCDSATFARDACHFQLRGFHLQTLKIIDNFPQTDHFEIFSIWN